jgi:hypothetical protein
MPFLFCPLYESYTHAQLACMRGIYKARLKDNTSCSDFIMTRQQHHVTTLVSVAPSSARLDSNIMSRLTSPQQHHRQHDSISTSCHDQVIPVAPSLSWLGGLIHTSPTGRPAWRFTTRLGGSRSTSPTDGRTQARVYLHRRPQLKASASSP